MLFHIIGKMDAAKIAEENWFEFFVKDNLKFILTEMFPGAPFKCGATKDEGEGIIDYANNGEHCFVLNPGVFRRCSFGGTTSSIDNINLLWSALFMAVRLMMWNEQMVKRPLRAASLSRFGMPIPQCLKTLFEWGHEEGGQDQDVKVMSFFGVQYILMSATAGESVCPAVLRSLKEGT